MAQAINILADPLVAFENPLTSRLGNLNSVGLTAQSRLAAAILDPGVRPNNVTVEEWEDRIAERLNLRDVFQTVYTNPDSYVAQFTQYSDFMSGRLGMATPFPSNLLGNGGLAAGVGGGMLALATFKTALSMASSEKTVNKRVCVPAPGLEPLAMPAECAGSTSIFATILGGFNSVMEAAATSLGAIADFLSQTAANLRTIQDQVNAFADAMIERVSREMTKLAEMILKVLSFANLDFLNSMVSDPCTKAILGQIAAPALSALINIQNPSQLLPALNIPDYL